MMECREVLRLESIIKGYEVGIIKILDKWSITEKDKDEIMNLITRIEEDTIKIVIEKQKDQIYRKKYKYIEKEGI